MTAIAGIIPVAKWLAKIKQRSDVGCKGRKNNAVHALPG